MIPIQMAMGMMTFKKYDLGLRNDLKSVFLFFCFNAIFFCHHAYAFVWQFRPNLSMGEIFDDNLNLSQINRLGGFSSEVTPGFILKGQSPMSNLNMNYRMQGLYNAQNSDAINIYHQLDMTSRFQPIQNTFFVDTDASISQQNASNSLLATDNVAGNGGMAETKSFSVTPYLTPHIGQYATGMLKVGYTGGYVTEPAIYQNSTLISSPLSNSQTILKQGSLTSGSYFGVLSWNLNYTSQDQRNSSNSDVLFETYAASTRYYLRRQFNVFAQIGYENNHYLTQQPGTTNANSNLKDGFDYTVGGQWRPSMWYSLEVGLGNNSHATMQYNPSNNLTSHLTYNYATVGLNLGSSWNAGLNYSRGMSTWIFSYQQDTTTVQQLLLQQTTVFVTNPVTGAQTTPYNISLPTLVNDVLIVKHAELNFSYRTGKSNYNVRVYNERRTDQVTQELDTIDGISGGWNWQMQPRLTFFLQPSLQSEQSTLSTSNNNLYEVALGVTRGIPVYWGRPLLLNSTLQAQHTQQLSGTVGNDYVENRITANFFVQF